ncbi:MAG: hypothetical protein ACSHX7_03560 [Luteolibacter sp.]
MRSSLITLLLLSLPLHAGEPRTWSNPEGTKSFSAEFVDREGEIVSLLRSDGKKFDIKISRLHKDDQAWIEKEHPPGSKSDIDVPPEGAVFDTLEFGDHQDVVSDKLKASKMLDGSVTGLFQGRTGFNGVYRINEKVGGLYCYLFFDWDENRCLREITLRTESKPGDQYDSTLQSCWDALIELMKPIYGMPVNAATYPKLALLKSGQIIGSHLWKLENGACALLGTSRMDDTYQVSLRFTTEDIQANTEK